MSTTNQAEDTFDSLLTELRTFPVPLLPPGTSHDPQLTSRISSLMLHPTLECLFHILNHDLPSAHFLVRHMQSPPAWEGMYIHGLLHRVEGDMDNCRAWYGDVAGSEPFIKFWGEGSGGKGEGLVREVLGGEFEEMAGKVKEVEDSDEKGPRLMKTVDGDQKVPSQEGARAFVSAVEELKNRKVTGKGYEERKEGLEKVSRAEIDALLSYCVDKFGTEKVLDASHVWVQPDEENRKMAEDMVSGGEGYRKF